MPPIPVKQPKSVKPFNMESTLGDLSNIRARGIDLSILLEPSKDASSDAQSDKAVKKSQEFIESVRGAFEVDGDVAAQGDRVEAVTEEVATTAMEAAFCPEVKWEAEVKVRLPGARNLNQSLRAITIRQIYTADQTHSDADFTIDGVETSQITLVAQVVAASKQATNIMYKLNDGTAEIKAKHWFESSEEEEMGHGQKIVTDPMEIYYHLIEAHLVHLHYTKGLVATAPGAISTGAPAASVYQAGGKGQQSRFASFPPLQRRILEVLEQLMPQHEQGVHVTTIASGLDVQASIDDIGATMEKLAEEGHIYATTDDEHFAIS
ncbi:unnamed protein product [Rhizoctonia solani]|uniref:Replication protein A C-terminal domain-containing protein n=1 Tax=Rhizoctonia solani TaxID=456999 RepID=A0A8H3H1P0_9AGAM|nr:unnamed protein product [Rhizoctonia solani]